MDISDYAFGLAVASAVGSIANFVIVMLSSAWRQWGAK